MSTAELRELVRDALAGRLGPQGWVLVGDGRWGAVAELVRPLGGGIEATAEVRCAAGSPNRPPLEISGLSVGVGYEPLRRLAPLLGDWFLLGVVEEDVGDLVDRREDPEALLKVGGAADVARAADRLAALVSKHVPRYRDVDALLEEFDTADIRRAALLAAAERPDSAREALNLDVPRRERFERRAAYQLRRWIERGGDPSLIPAAPPPSRFDASEPDSVGETWRRARAVRAAVEEVIRRGRGRDRAELRSMLEHELSERGVTEDPLWYERTLDHLWDSRAERVQRTASTLLAAGRFGLRAVQAIRNRELPDLAAPEWLEPPEPAFYELPRSGRWAAVLLDPDVGDWLDRVYAAVPRLAGSTVSLEAWLDAELAVHLGERRVGIVSEAELYAGVMEDAAFRGELPCLAARLTNVPPYLLELAAPRG